MNNYPIGIFDSGVGGLSIVEQIKKLLPNESVIYLADRKNFPYGEKTAKQIRKISLKNVQWLLSQDVKIIVVACNTATVWAIAYLRKKFPNTNFVGMEPAIKPAAKRSKIGFAVLSSTQTTKSKQLTSLITKFARNLKVINIGSLELVRAVEENSSSKKLQEILRRTIPDHVLQNIDTLVLGCTHFPLIKKQIQKYTGRKIKIIDSGEAVAKRINFVLENNNLLSKEKNPSYSFFTTSKTEEFRGIMFQEIKRVQGI